LLNRTPHQRATSSKKPLREVLDGYTLVHHETNTTSTPAGKKEAPTDFRGLGIGIAVLENDDLQEAVMSTVNTAMANG
jgi:hypothetical protein